MYSIVFDGRSSQANNNQPIRHSAFECLAKNLIHKFIIFIADLSSLLFKHMVLTLFSIAVLIYPLYKTNIVKFKVLFFQKAQIWSRHCIEHIHKVQIIYGKI